MSLGLGIIGLPNSGKSTIFNALTSGNAEVASFPFCTIAPNVGMVPVPEPRLDIVGDILGIARRIPSPLRLVDIAGLIKGASRGEGLGNRFLAQIREMDAILHVLRCFPGEDIPHVSGEINPRADAAVVELEMLLADLDAVDRRLEKVVKKAKSGEDAARDEAGRLELLRNGIESGLPAREILTGNDRIPGFSDQVGELSLLSAKPVLYVANVSEEDAGREDGGPLGGRVKEMAAASGCGFVWISGKLESELAELEPSERREFLAELGIGEAAHQRVIRAGWDLLDLITFFTATGGKEVRAWALTRGSTALEAAGRIHSDMERGFIAAEVVSVNELASRGSLANARERGVMRLEGKGYKVVDGDILHFRFNV